MDLVQVHGPAEEQTAARVRTRLTALAEEDHAVEGFGAALAALRDALSDVRAWPLLTSERKPWSASGGMVHLTDIAHAGTTGRQRIFVVGLDADRTGGSGRQDPLLTDAVRSALGGALTTSAERREGMQYRIASALAALRGRVTLSYATSGALDGREAGPSPFLLQAFRLLWHEAELSYEALRGHLTPPASPVPAREDGALAGIALLDARDVWMDALADGALLLDGERPVREAFPLLDAGLSARSAAEGPELSPYTGLVQRAAGVLDPRREPVRAISPSSLETLSACPLSWFYRYGLSLHAPDDPEYDAEAWLDAAQRGSVLHEIFEQFAVRYADRQRDVLLPESEDAIREIADGVIEKFRIEVPPPGEAVFASECEEIHRASRTFLEMERQSLERGDDGRWSRFEYAFEPPGAIGVYQLTDGTSLYVRGRVDRIDELPDGSLRVIDYKTGRAGRYQKEPKKGAFRGGRQLQPALYSASVAGLLGQNVARFEYRFPTERGENEIVAYSEAELAAAQPLITQLLSHARDGAFIPTTDSKDCSYCDYRPICRTNDLGFYKIETPRVAWAAQNAGTLAAYKDMLARRSATAGGEA
jgi:CRISPR/Cas system-associated exonuclease Cas4 (RecB family)